MTPSLALNLAPRGECKVDSTNRGEIRKWIIRQGATYSMIQNLTVGELSEIYNDTSDRALNALLATAPKDDTPAPAPAPVRANPAPAPLPVSPDMDARAQILLQLLNPQPAAIDEARIIDLIRQHAPTPEPRELTVRVADRPPVTLSRQHFKFPLLLACLAAKVPVWLVGPAGTGKTSAAAAAAEALGLSFDCASFNPMTSKGDLFGFKDATGQYHETGLVRMARDGGVFLGDEIDAGNPGVLTGINMVTANPQFSTPAGLVPRHENFRMIAAANTYGTGASREYVGRNQADAATLDRFAFIDWPIDTGLEASFVGLSEPSPSFDLAAGGVPTVAEWLATVRAVRDKVGPAGLRHVVSPRAVLLGTALIGAGVGIKHLKDMLLRKGLDDVAAGKLGL